MESDLFNILAAVVTFWLTASLTWIAALAFILVCFRVSNLIAQWRDRRAAK